MTRPSFSLRYLGTVLVISALLCGAAAGWLWMQSTQKWRGHLDGAYLAGVVLHNALQNGTTPPQGITITALTGADLAAANNGQFRAISGVAATAQPTNVPISSDLRALMILSPTLRYKLADLPRRDGQTGAETLGSVTRLLASYCSDPVVLAHMDDDRWLRIAGGPVWGCAAAPPDRRLLAALIMAIAAGALMTIVLNITADFTAFADQLRNRRQVGGPTSYDIAGPSELREIVSAVNAYLEFERTQLEKRAAVLSGVSHDLGTPATRLRLRTALIPDDELRHKLEADIDSMTGIIESVLTYTRAEMSAEAPRKLSLNTLIEAIVDDYQDTGSPVTFRGVDMQAVRVGRSVFASGQERMITPSERPVIAMARPVSLTRAVGNLIDNALKYGRRATVGIEMDAAFATIVIEDDGSDSSAIEMEALMAPFARGDNTSTIDGHGLGLTIVATIAGLHGGTLTFADTSRGLQARLRVQRS